MKNFKTLGLVVVAVVALAFTNAYHGLFFGTLQDSAFTASRVLVTDGSKNIVSTTVTSTTLAFLDATSSIQTQLNGKAGWAGPFTNLTTYGTTTQTGSGYATDDFPNGWLVTSSGGKSGTNNIPMYYTNALHFLATLFDSTGSAGTAGAPWKSAGASAAAGWSTDNGSYTIDFNGLGAGATPAANTTLRAGRLSANWNQYTAASKSSYIVGQAGTITSIAYQVMGTGGDAVNTVAVSLILNGTTVFATDTFTWTSFPVRRTVLTVNQAIAVNDYIDVQVVTPVGWTAPTVCTLNAYAIVHTTNN